MSTHLPLRAIAAAGLFAALAVAGCGGNSAAPAVTVSPPSATVTPGGQQQFFGHVDNALDPRVNFSVQQGAGAAGGTIDANGLYTAPASATAGAQDTIIVSARDGSAPPVQVPVIIELGVEVTPPVVELSVGRTQQFTAQVHGDPDNRVTWSVREGAGGGAITDEGVYTPPANAANGAVFTIVATSVSDPGRSDTAAVVIRSGNLPVNVQ